MSINRGSAHVHHRVWQKPQSSIKLKCPVYSLKLSKQHKKCQILQPQTFKAAQKGVLLMYITGFLAKASKQPKIKMSKSLQPQTFKAA
jgi:hypothetical protein